MSADVAQPAFEALMSRGSAVERRADRRPPPPPTREGLLHGWTETVKVTPGAVHFIGWAADVDRGESASEVVLMVGNRPVRWELPNRERPDVASHFGIAALRHSGYLLTVRAGELDGVQPDRVRVLGFTATGEAQQLAKTPEAACALAQLWWRRGGRDSAPTEPLDRLPLAQGAGPPGLRVEPALTGAVDVAEEAGECLRIRGWALETSTRRPPERLLVADGNRIVATGAGGLARPDVAARFPGGEAERCGFELIVPLEALRAPWQRGLRVVAAGQGRRARLGFVGGRPAAP
jgi:hypothetical protein